MRTYLTMAAGAAMGALVASGPAYLYGKAQGRQQAAVAALEASMKAIQKREDIDHEVDRADLIDICIELGGLPERCQLELRRLDPSAKAE